MKEVTAEECETWLKENRETDPTKKILRCDIAGFFGFINEETDEGILVPLQDASKSDYIKSFISESFKIRRRKDAESTLKQSYKYAINNGVDVQLTEEWFSSPVLD